MGIGTRVPAERGPSEGARVPPSGAASGEGGQWNDHAAPRGTPRGRRCGDPVPAKSPLDGIGEGPRGAGDSTAEPRRAGREGGEPRTGVRDSGGGLRRSRGVDRGTGGVSRARTSTDERFVCKPPGRNGEDLRRSRGLRHPARGCGASGTGIDSSGAVERCVGGPTRSKGKFLCRTQKDHGGGGKRGSVPGSDFD